MPETCAFCGEPAVGHCAWVGPKPVTLPVFELLHGDRVFSFDNPDVSGLVAVIESHEGRARVTLSGKYSGKKLVRWDSKVNVERVAACEKPCCEKHSRDLGVDHFQHIICADHWRAQREAVAC
jgi:hypothetical protein